VNPTIQRSCMATLFQFSRLNKIEAAVERQLKRQPAPHGFGQPIKSWPFFCPQLRLPNITAGFRQKSIRVLLSHCNLCKRGNSI
jgi:hypothetical protein